MNVRTLLSMERIHGAGKEGEETVQGVRATRIIIYTYMELSKNKFSH